MEQGDLLIRSPRHAHQQYSAAFGIAVRPSMPNTPGQVGIRHHRLTATPEVD